MAKTYVFLSSMSFVQNAKVIIIASIICSVARCSLANNYDYIRIHLRNAHIKQQIA